MFMEFLLITLGSFFWFWLAENGRGFLYNRFSSYQIANDVLRHQLFFISEFSVPINTLTHMRLSYESPFEIEKDLLVYQFQLPLQDSLVIIHQKNGKTIKNIAYPENLFQLRGEIFANVSLLNKQIEINHNLEIKNQSVS